MNVYARALAQLARDLGLEEVSARIPINFNEDASVMATALITVRITSAPVEIPIETLPLDVSLMAGEALNVHIDQIASHPEPLMIVAVHGELEHGTVEHTAEDFTYTANADVEGDVVETFEVEVDFLA